MVPGIHRLLSALKAFGVKAHVTASHAANANTEGARILRDTTHGPQLVELSNVDLGEVAANLIVAQRGFEAHLAALRTHDEMTESLMDIIGGRRRDALGSTPFHCALSSHRTPRRLASGCPVPEAS